MKTKSLIFVVGFAAVFSFLFNAPSVKAMTAAEIQALIGQLQQQIVELQKQLTEAQGQPAAWCHDFNTNLKIGDSGPHIAALQTALQKEGFLSGMTNEFDEETASAVVGFQEKYADEILSSFNLKRGTGFVGKGTRVKLNQLYGCKEAMSAVPAVPATPAQPPVVTTATTSSATPATPATPATSAQPTTSAVPYISVIYPNGGEQWLRGNAYDIAWSSNKINAVNIDLQGSSTVRHIAFGVPAAKGRFTWPVPLDQPLESKYQVFIWDDSNRIKAQDWSDGYFSIVSTTTPAVATTTATAATSTLTITPTATSTPTTATTTTQTQTQIQTPTTAASGTTSLNWPQLTNGCNPKTAWSGSEYGVVWSKICNSGENEIYFNRFTNAGAKIGQDLVVSTGHQTADSNYALVWDGTGYAVVWEDYWGNVPLHSNSESDYSTYLSKVNSQGQKSIADVKIDTGYQYKQMNLFWNNSEYVLIYYRFIEVRFRKLSANGQVLSSKPISSPPGDVVRLSAVWTGTEYNVTWEYLYASPGNPTGSSSVRLSANGDLIVATTPTTTAATSTATTTTSTTSTSTTSTSTYTCPAPTSNGQITVVAPASGESLVQGSQYTVRWTALSAINTVSLNLLQKDLYLYQIVSDVPNTGSYVWTAPSNYSGSNFQMYISAWGYVPGRGSCFNITTPTTTAATTTAATTTAVFYPGYFMTTDKQSYSRGDIISLTIRRADSGSYPAFVEFSIVAPGGTSAQRVIINSNLDVSAAGGVTVQINSSSTEPLKSGASGSYLLLLCATGQSCGGGYTNSAALTYANDTAPPVISNIQISNIATSSATITWTTDEPATLELSYSTDPSFLVGTAVGDPTLTTSHSRTISGLQSGVLYHFRITSRDAAGNLAQSQDQTFTTLTPTPPPSITLISPNGGETWQAGTTYTITWTSTGNINGVILFLADEVGAAYVTNLVNVNGNPQTAQWNASAYLGSGNHYKILIHGCSAYNCVVGDTKSTASSVASDLSDGSFSIIAATSTATTTAKNIENQLADIAAAIRRLAGEVKKLLGGR